MEQQFGTNAATIVIAATPNLNAGGSMGSERLDSNRLTDTANGSKLGQITYTIQLELATTAKGSIEYCCFRTERSFAAPVLGTDPFPTAVEIKDSGLQQMMRSNLPGWVLKFGAFPVSGEFPSVRTVKVSPSRMGAPAMRDGDYHGIVIFNRSDGTINFSVQMRYRSFR